MKGIKTRDSGRVGLSLFHIYFLAGCLGPVLPILPVASKTTTTQKKRSGCLDDAATAIANARRLIDAVPAVVISRR
jgi:hypothetical protein